MERIASGLKHLAVDKGTRRSSVEIQGQMSNDRAETGQASEKRNDTRPPVIPRNKKYPFGSRAKGLASRISSSSEGQVSNESSIEKQELKLSSESGEISSMALDEKHSTPTEESSVLEGLTDHAGPLAESTTIEESQSVVASETSSTRKYPFGKRGNRSRTMSATSTRESNRDESIQMSFNETQEVSIQEESPSLLVDETIESTAQEKPNRDYPFGSKAQSRNESFKSSYEEEQAEPTSTRRFARPPRTVRTDSSYSNKSGQSSEDNYIDRSSMYEKRHYQPPPHRKNYPFGRKAEERRVAEAEVAKEAGKSDDQPCQNGEDVEKNEPAPREVSQDRSSSFHDRDRSTQSSSRRPYSFNRQANSTRSSSSFRSVSPSTEQPREERVERMNQERPPPASRRGNYPFGSKRGTGTRRMDSREPEGADETGSNSYQQVESPPRQEYDAPRSSFTRVAARRGDNERPPTIPTGANYPYGRRASQRDDPNAPFVKSSFERRASKLASDPRPQLTGRRDSQLKLNTHPREFVPSKQEGSMKMSRSKSTDIYSPDPNAPTSPVKTVLMLAPNGLAVPVDVNMA